MCRIISTLAGILVAFAACGAAQPDALLTLTIVVHNYAAVPPGVFPQIRTDADDAFESAGIRLTWVVCTWAAREPRPQACESQSGAGILVLRLMPTRPRTAGVLGAATQGQSATVYCPEVRDTARVVMISECRLLARVAVHELGHLLLGPGAHSRAGIMQAVWSPAGIDRPAAGWRFTAAQAALIRQRVARLTAETQRA